MSISLASLVKENATLKNDLKTQKTELLAAEHALVLLAQENNELVLRARATEDAQQAALKDLRRKLEVAEDKIATRDAAVEQRDAEIRRLRAHAATKEESTTRAATKKTTNDDTHVEGLHVSIAKLLKTNEDLSRENELLRAQRNGEIGASTEEPPISKKSPSSRYSSIDSRTDDRGRLRSPSPRRAYSRSISRSRSPPRAGVKSRYPSLPQRPTEAFSERLTFGEYMSNKFPISIPDLDHRTRDWHFSASQAVQSVHRAEHFFQTEVLPGPRKPLYLPSRLCRTGGYGHALGYAPSHVYSTLLGAWLENKELSALVESEEEVDLFVKIGERVHYAGVYRIVSLRGVHGYNPPTLIVNPELSSGELKRLTNIAAAEKAMALSGYPFPDTQPRVECFGLRFLRYDEELLSVLVERFKAAGGGFVDKPAVTGNMNAKRKHWQGSSYRPRSMPVRNGWRDGDPDVDEFGRERDRKRVREGD